MNVRYEALDDRKRALLTRREFVAMHVMTAAIGNDALVRRVYEKGSTLGEFAALETDEMLKALYGEDCQDVRKGGAV